MTVTRFARPDVPGNDGALPAAYMLGTFWGAGNETMPMAAGVAHGSPARRNVLLESWHSSAPTGIVSSR